MACYISVSPNEYILLLLWFLYWASNVKSSCFLLYNSPGGYTAQALIN